MDEIKKIKIYEVWNSEGKTVEIGVIDAILLPSRHVDRASSAREVERWIECNRSDLSLARDINAHGYYAREV